MFSRVFHVLLLGQICVAAAVIGPGNREESEAIGKRSTDPHTGPFPGGWSYTPRTIPITIEIPKNHFCGNENLTNVAQRLDQTKLYSTDLDGYLEELQKATAIQRAKMARANLQNAINNTDWLDKLFNNCPQMDKADYSNEGRNLLAWKRGWSVFIVKALVGDTIQGTVNFLVKEAFSPNATKANAEIAFSIFCGVLAKDIVYRVIDDFDLLANNRYLLGLEAQVEAVATLFAVSVRNLMNYLTTKYLQTNSAQASLDRCSSTQVINFDGTVTWNQNGAYDPNGNGNGNGNENGGNNNAKVKRSSCVDVCPLMDSANWDALATAMQTMDGGNDFPYRSTWDAENVNNAGIVNACPANIYQYGASGAVVP